MESQYIKCITDLGLITLQLSQFKVKGQGHITILIPFFECVETGRQVNSVVTDLDCILPIRGF